MAFAVVVQGNDFLARHRHGHCLLVVFVALHRCRLGHVQPVLMEGHAKGAIQVLENLLFRFVLEDGNRTAGCVARAAVGDENLITRPQQHKPWALVKAGHILFDFETGGDLKWRRAIRPVDDLRAVARRRCVERVGQTVPVHRHLACLRKCHSNKQNTAKSNEDEASRARHSLQYRTFPAATPNGRSCERSRAISPLICNLARST